MNAAEITYDLVLLFDPSTEDAEKQRVLTSTRSAIEAQGEFIRHDEWGLRPLAYQIDHKGEAEYHLIQFHVREVALLAELDRSLRITDGVLRFMITKLAPGTPDPPQLGARTPRPAETEPVAPAPAAA
jgi:small subunit ribosomal protein S6